MMRDSSFKNNMKCRKRFTTGSSSIRQSGKEKIDLSMHLLLSP